MLVLLRRGPGLAAAAKRGSSLLLREKPHPVPRDLKERYAAWLAPAAYASVTPGDPATQGSTRVEAGGASLAHRARLVRPRGGHGRSVCKATSVSEETPNPDPAGQAARDIAEVPAVEVITTAAIHLMSAAAVKCGLAEGEDAREHLDLDEARRLITALAGLVSAAAPDLGSQHAAPLRDGLKSLQLAFREASAFPDPPGQGPGERLTGSVV